MGQSHRPRRGRGRPSMRSSASTRTSSYSMRPEEAGYNHFSSSSGLSSPSDCPSTSYTHSPKNTSSFVTPHTFTPHTSTSHTGHVRSVRGGLKRGTSLPRARPQATESVVVERENWEDGIDSDIRNRGEGVDGGGVPNRESGGDGGVGEVGDEVDEGSGEVMKGESGEMSDDKEKVDEGSGEVMKGESGEVGDDKEKVDEGSGEVMKGESGEVGDDKEKVDEGSGEVMKGESGEVGDDKEKVDEGSGEVMKGESGEVGDDKVDEGSGGVVKGEGEEEELVAEVDERAEDRESVEERCQPSAVTDEVEEEVEREREREDVCGEMREGEEVGECEETREGEGVSEEGEGEEGDTTQTQTVEDVELGVAAAVGSESGSSTDRLCEVAHTVTRDADNDLGVIDVESSHESECDVSPVQTTDRDHHFSPTDDERQQLTSSCEASSQVAVTEKIAMATSSGVGESKSEGALVAVAAKPATAEAEREKVSVFPPSLSWDLPVTTSETFIPGVNNCFSLSPAAPHFTPSPTSSHAHSLSNFTPSPTPHTPSPISHIPYPTYHIPSPISHTPSPISHPLSPAPQTQNLTLPLHLSSSHPPSLPPHSQNPPSFIPRTVMKCPVGWKDRRSVGLGRGNPVDNPRAFMLPGYPSCQPFTPHNMTFDPTLFVPPTPYYPGNWQF